MHEEDQPSSKERDDPPNVEDTPLDEAMDEPHSPSIIDTYMHIKRLEAQTYEHHAWQRVAHE